MLNYFSTFTKTSFKQTSFKQTSSISWRKISQSIPFFKKSHIFTISKNNQKLISKDENKITFSKFKLNYFSTSSSSDKNIEKDDKDINNNEEIIRFFNEEYEKALAANEEDQEKRIKLLSIKLLQLKKSKEIINLFEEKYIKGLVSKIYGEELTLFVYFYVSLVEKEIQYENFSQQNLKDEIDKKFEKILNMLINKLDELDITNLLALSWSISILISKFYYPIDSKLKEEIVAKLPNNIPIDKKGEIPSICFSISNYKEESNNALNELIQNKIAHYSSIFFSNAGLNYINTLNLSLLAMAWAKINMIDADLLNKTAEVLKDLKEGLNIDNLEEICKLIWVFNIFNFKHESIDEFLKFYLENYIDEIGINYAIDLFISYTNLYPENYELIEALIHLITEKYKESDDLVLDIVTYNNIWLAFSKFYAKSGKDAIESLPYLLNFLFSNYDKRSYLHVKNMTPEEVCSMLVCFSVLDLEPNSIYYDLAYYVKNNIGNFNNYLLLQLLSCGKYLFNTKKHSDLYYIIHDACCKSKDIFDNNQLKMIKKILITDGILTNSIFLSS